MSVENNALGLQPFLIKPKVADVSVPALLPRSWQELSMPAMRYANGRIASTCAPKKPFGFRLNTIAVDRDTVQIENSILLEFSHHPGRRDVLTPHIRRSNNVHCNSHLPLIQRGSARIRKMSSDATYSSFLDQANQGTGADNVSAKSDTAATKAVNTDVPPGLQSIEQYYSSESDEPFEPVSLTWDGKNLPSGSMSLVARDCQETCVLIKGVSQVNSLNSSATTSRCLRWRPQNLTRAAITRTCFKQ